MRIKDKVALVTGGSRGIGPGDLFASGRGGRQSRHC